MGGLIFDNILVFLFRTTLRIIREIRSERWNRTNAMVDGAFAPAREMYPYASLTYSYSVHGVEHYGRYERGYWDDYAARSFAKLYANGTTVVIRYQSTQPDRSYFCEDDQHSLTRAVTTR